MSAVPIVDDLGDDRRMAAPSRTRARSKTSKCSSNQQRVLLCTWWRPQLDQNRFSALSAPKRTPSYSPELREREPERFLDAGSEIILLKPYGDDRYRAWWFEVDGRGSFYAYDAELQKFSEALIKPNSTSGQGALILDFAHAGSPMAIRAARGRIVESEEAT